MKPTVHIGQAIEARIKELGKVKRRVAQEMAMSPQNLNSIFRSPTIRTDLLEKFSRLLEMNFFLLYRGLNENENPNPELILPEDPGPKKIEIILNEDGSAQDESSKKKLDEIHKQLSELTEEVKELMELKAIADHLHSLSEDLESISRKKRS